MPRPWDFELDILENQISSMSQPVCCRCGQIYDLGKVIIEDRYLDCSTWRTPCCKQLADDRGEYAPGWTSVNWYERIDRHNPVPRGYQRWYK